MNLITAFLLMILTGHSTCEYVQKLSCPYENKTQNRLRVWCKREANDQNCCSGFSFLSGAKVLEQGNIAVEDDGKSFTVSIKTLTQGDGVYWCGLVTEGKVIIKLAEDYFTDAPFNFVWSILRWIFFICLLMMTISTHIYSNMKHGDTKTA
ncbi:CMRF35-like molecule 6 [Carassius carassius]|uniref:CMRF35-like molecule 6 n=1 Tax=Carassius carassius TaxID=217509 RepID=UPI002868E0BB|nr:CMRF35-like molecule 6 [Carassius carassius]